MVDLGSDIMSKRKHSPLHDYWHPRVEGQIRDTIYHHPEWFHFVTEQQKKDCINSLAKRIVGEIIAGRPSTGDDASEA